MQKEKKQSVIADRVLNFLLNNLSNLQILKFYDAVNHEMDFHAWAKQKITFWY